MPAEHACPECGLRYDARCAVYRLLNPKQALVLWIAIFCSGWSVLQHLPHLGNFDAASWWQRIGAVAAVIWFPFVASIVWILVRRYRQGFMVAVTVDSLIVRLPAFSDEPIPWSRVVDVSAKDRGKGHAARLVLRDPDKTVEIGGTAKLFSSRAELEGFVGKVEERIQNSESRIQNGGAACGGDGGRGEDRSG